jgi:large repetitive protein
VAVSALTNQLVFQLASWDFSTGSGSSSAYTATAASGETLNWFTNLYDASSSKYTISSGGDVRAGPASTTASTVTSTLTLSSSRRFASIGVSIKGAVLSVTGSGGSSGPATNVAVFAQTPAFVQPFTILSNSLVTVTNYITVTNGAANLTTTNPLVQIWLLTNGVSFMQMSNAIYGSDTYGRKLSWSGSLKNNVTIPAGAAISYLISNGVSGLAFHINYDSTNAQSKITFPTTSVITISNLSICGARYPATNAVGTATAGSPVYVQATVSDPFGNYDITSLSLLVTAPATNYNQSLLLTSNAVVSTATTNYEVFQYMLATAPSPGTYNVVATANEGTEGVTANALAALNTVVLDLGTPATTCFTVTNTGAVTNSYPANGTAWIMIADSGAITNSATIQTITATVTSTSGDSELLTLTETAPNSGVFTGGLLTATNSGAGNNNGLLLAPVSAVLTVTYSNAVGITTANASIQPPPGSPASPNVVIYNTITYPGSQLLRGQTVTHNLQVINVGNTNLPNLNISDVFPTNMTFASAGLAYNTTATNGGKNAITLTWTNLGALAVGQSTNLVVNFTAAAVGPVTNVATANAVTATNSATALAAVYNPSVSVTKSLLSPTNQPVAVGSNVVFQIVVANTGNTAINNLPMEDNFSGSYYQSGISHLS